MTDVKNLEDLFQSKIDAELKIEGKETKTPEKNPAVREFETPEINAGALYEYTFSAT